MDCSCSPSLVEELEQVLKAGSADRRNEILHRVTDLFINAAPSCKDEHVAVFDDVLDRLVDKVERYALIRLSMRLAPVENAPPNVVHRLADSDDIAVSGPLIERSVILGDDFLIRIAEAKSQAHLAAIAARPHISERVVDVVVDRADRAVTHKIVANDGAQFSARSLATAAARALNDEELAVSLIDRDDVDDEIVDDLLQKATEIVRRRLLSTYPDLKRRIDHALASVPDRIPDRSSSNTSAKGFLVQSRDDDLKRRLCNMAREGARAETIHLMAKIAQVPTESVKTLIRQGTEDGVLILCKACGLGWADVKNVLAVTVGADVGDKERAKAFSKYIAFTSETAQRVIRFLRLRRTMNKADLNKLM